MRGLFVFLLFIISTVFLSACVQEEPLPQETSINEFGSQGDFAAYIQGNKDIKNRISAKYTSEVKRITEKDISIYSFSDNPFGSELGYIRLNGNNIHYKYYLNGYDGIERPSNKNMPRNIPSNTTENRTPSSTPDVENNTRRNEIPEANQETIDDLENAISLSWNFSAEGKEALDYLVTTNEGYVFEVENYPDVYYSDVVYGPDDKLYGKVLYWEQDGYMFQAYFPLKELEEVMSTPEGIKGMVGPQKYSATTFKAIP